MQKRHIYFFIGTTAELIKVAPIIKEFNKRGVEFKIITSGQNKIDFDALSGFIGGLKPDISFREKVNKSSVLHFLIWTIRTFLLSLFLLNKEFKGLNKKNSYFIIHGDTISSTMGALIGRIFRLKLVHIESGDLSFNLFEPFPEEICRSINIRLSDVLFTPNDWAKNNLKKIKGIKINTYYNTLVESFLWAKSLETNINVKKYKKYYVLFMRRQEHVIFKKDWSRKILELVIKNSHPNLNCLIVSNPLITSIIDSKKFKVFIKGNKKIKLISSLSYPNFMKLVSEAEFIATDGCTNQLESYLLGKPCLVLRDLTEQIEGLGKNVVLCKSDENIIKQFLLSYKKYNRRHPSIKTRPSKIIVDYLMKY